MESLWRVDRAPRVGPLRAAAATMSALPAAAAAIRIDPAADLADPQTLLAPVVGVRLVTHPSVATLLHAAGATLDGNTWAIPTPTTPRAAQALVARVHPTTWVDAQGHPLTTEQVATALATPPPARRPTPAAQPGPGRLAVHPGRRHVRVRLALDPVEVPVPSGTVTLTPSRTTRLRPADLPRVVSALRKAGIVVVDADTAGRLTDLGWTHDRRLVLTPAPGAPGWALADAGPLVTSPLPQIATAADAVAGVRPARGKVAVAVHPATTAAAATATAGSRAPHTQLVALRSWQEQFIGQYLAGGTGLVNALPPGTGKTACVAAAWATAAQDIPTHRGMVIAAPTLLEQWATELARFHPTATVVLATTEPDLDVLNRTWASPVPAVAVLTPGLVTRHAQRLADLGCHDLAVDEGTWLRSPSAQTAATWQVRRGADRVAVLTGTPDLAPGTVEALVGFAAGDPDLMTGPVHPTLAGMDALDRAGPWVFGTSADLAAHLPTTPRTDLPVIPGTLEAALQRTATRRVQTLLAQATTPAKARKVATTLRTELNLWRTGLACPPALLAGRSALAAALRTDLDLDNPTNPLTARQWADRLGTPAKVRAVADWVTRQHTDGHQCLVFADSPAALDVLAAHLPVPHGLVATLSGKVRPAARARAVEAFTAGTVRVLLVAGVGQLGLNLQTATHIAHLDVPASAAMAAQRTGRAVRLGASSDQVEVLLPYLEGTAEHIWAAHATGTGTPVDTLGLATTLTKPPGRKRRS